jgi:glycerophosphoryl diester phosphodiesterase
LVHFFAFGQRDVAEIRAAFIDATSPHILVAAHRAAHQEFPENSLPAIQHAIDMGVDIIEIDVKVTMDGTPVLMHDRTIDRTTTGTGDPETYSLQELQEFRLVAAGDTTELTIPTLEAALNLAKGHIMVDLDLKTDKMEAILEVVRKTGTEDIVFFFDSEYPSLHYLQEEDNNLMLMPRAYSYAMADSAIALFHPQVVHIDFSFYTPEVIKLIKDNHARVWINALGEPDAHIRQGMAATAIDTLLMYGANIIQTDEPELLLEALKARELHP